jgi:hypothetical protein
MEDAQRFSQGAIDQNSADIEAWIQGNPPRPTLPIVGTFNNPTGESVTRDDYLAHGENAPVHEVHEVKTILRRDPSLNPPFSVITSYPQ